MIVCPNAKINLGLRIRNKREDGYHNLSGYFLPIGLSDVLEIVPAKDNVFELQVSGIKIEGNTEDNLCFKAYKLIKDKYKIDAVKIHLHKQIPSGAGLGGGSSDAANTLLLLDRIFSLNIAEKELLQMAAQLGSDCSFFIKNKTSYVNGVGDVLYDLEDFLNNYFIQLYKPDFGISTAEAYSGVNISGEKIAKLDYKKLKENNFYKLFENDFEKHLFNKYPELGNIKELIKSNNSVYASMTGSGSAIYGIYKNKPEAIPDLKDYLIWEGEL